MAIDLKLYSKIKDKYCITYLGSCDEYLIQLKLLRPLLEAKYPGLEIYICSKNNSYDLIADEPKTLKYSDLKEHQNQFAYVRNISYEEYAHPIESLLTECGLVRYSITNCNKDLTNLCGIYSQGIYPTKSLNTDQIKKLCRYISDRGFVPVVDKPDLTGIGWAIGVENQFMFLAGAKGLKTTLISTGLGTNLFKTMFPSAEILLPQHI